MYSVQVANWLRIEHSRVNDLSVSQLVELDRNCPGCPDSVKNLVFKGIDWLLEIMRNILFYKSVINNETFFFSINIIDLIVNFHLDGKISKNNFIDFLIHKLKYFY